MLERKSEMDERMMRKRMTSFLAEMCCPKGNWTKLRFFKSHIHDPMPQLGSKYATDQSGDEENIGPYGHVFI